MLQVLQLESLGGTLLLQLLLFHRLKKKTAEKTGASFRIRSYFILTFCIASFGRFAGWWGHDRKSRFEMGHGKYCFLLFLFVVILFLSEWRKQKVLVWNGLSFRGIMIGSTCSVFKCLTCDQPFFFTAVYRLLNVVCALVDQNMWLRLFIEFKSLPGAAGFQLSNPPLWQAVSLLGSLNVSTGNALILPSVQRKWCPTAWGWRIWWIQESI